METVQSNDGTDIAFDRSGDGAAVILVGGAMRDRSGDAALAGLLASEFAVLTYDRRGRGDSGDTPPYAVDREVEDLPYYAQAKRGPEPGPPTDLSIDAAFALIRVDALWPRVETPAPPALPYWSGPRIGHLVLPGGTM